jgi:hypothetical protein
VGAAGRKACANCTCGRAEGEDKPAQLTREMLDNPTSGCGSVSGICCRRGRLAPGPAAMLRCCAAAGCLLPHGAAAEPPREAEQPLWPAASYCLSPTLSPPAPQPLFVVQCGLGDAFRCGGCPYRGLPAFQMGKKIELPPDFLAVDL